MDQTQIMDLKPHNGLKRVTEDLDLDGLEENNNMKPAKYRGSMLLDSIENETSQLRRHPSIEDVLVYKNSYQQPNLHEEKGLGDLIAELPPIQTYVLDENYELPPVPSLLRNSSSINGSSMNGIFDNNTDGNDSENELPGEKENFLDLSEASPTNSPKPLFRKVSNYLEVAKGFFGKVVSDKVLKPGPEVQRANSQKASNAKEK
jgi:hypothetical protein